MPITGITRPGLTVMAILVAILWGCFVSERLTVQKANLEMERALRAMPRPGSALPAALPRQSSLRARPTA